MSTPSQAILDEAGYRAALSALAWADASERGKIVLRGADRVKLLQNLCTNDLAKLPDGAGCEAIFLDAKGRVVEYAVAFKAADAVWLDVEPGRAAATIKLLDRYVIREDVQFEDATAAFGQIALYGPDAAAMVKKLLGLDVDAWPNLTNASAQFADSAAMVRRLDRAIVPTFEFLAPSKAIAVLIGALTAAAPTAPRLDRSAIELLRIEAGLPRMGIDIEEGNLAQEIGRNDQAISFTKGCYLGQETVARMDALGHVNRQLQGLVFDGKAAIEPGAKLFLGDKLAGHIASVAWSPTLNATIAIAMLRTAGVGVGTAVDTSSDEAANRAVVRPFPLI